MIYTHLAAALLSLVLGFSAAWKVQGWRWAAAEKARIEADAEALAARSRSADKAAEAHEKDKAADRVEFRTIIQEVERVVEKPIYRDRECLDADGLRVIRAAIAGRPAPAASEPARALPPDP